MSKEKMAAEVMYLSVLVNQNTELAVFIDFSGHVDKLSVHTTESKENYHIRILNKYAYLDEEKAPGLELIRSELINILADHNVSYEPLFCQESTREEDVRDTASDNLRLSDRVEALEKEMAELKELIRPEERGAGDVPEELSRSGGDRQSYQEWVDDRLQEVN